MPTLRPTPGTLEAELQQRASLAPSMQLMRDVRERAAVATLAAKRARAGLLLIGLASQVGLGST